MTGATLDKETLIRFVMDAARRSMAHYGFWFKETEYQVGLEEALLIEQQAGDMSLAIQLKRLGKVLGFELKNGVPAVLYDMSEEKLGELLDALSANWLANDGVWFQALENRFTIYDAKHANDACWSRFSPLEASRIKVLLDLPDQGGLEALKTALDYRLYARLNTSEIVEETANSFVFRNVDCRVQSARRRKGLEAYDCRSVGIVEYRTFASTIDKRIKTECVGCPPENPDDWWCGWRFSIE